MALDMQELAALAVVVGQDIAFEEYQTVTPVWDQLASTEIISADNMNLYGRKRKVFENAGELHEYDDLEDIEADNPRVAFTAQAKTRPRGRKIVLADRALAAINTGPRNVIERQMRNYLEEQISGFGDQAARAPDRWLAKSMEAGVKSAGNVAYFNDSYLDNVDPHPAHVYDGKAWFATDHPLGDGSTLSNLLPDLPLTSDNLEVAKTHFRSVMSRSHRGSEIELPEPILVVPVALQPVAQRLTMSAQDPDGSTNAVNVNQETEYRVLRNLTKADGWFLVAPRFGLRIGTSGPPAVRSAPRISNGSVEFVVNMYHSQLIHDIRFGLACNYSAS